jgi:hypothetical protein
MKIIMILKLIFKKKKKINKMINNIFHVWIKVLYYSLLCIYFFLYNYKFIFIINIIEIIINKIIKFKYIKF